MRQYDSVPPRFCRSLNIAFISRIGIFGNEFSRPCGTCARPNLAFPALKRRAILNCPYGTVAGCQPSLRDLRCSTPWTRLKCRAILGCPYGTTELSRCDQNRTVCDTTMGRRSLLWPAIVLFKPPYFCGRTTSLHSIARTGRVPMLK